LFEFQNLKNPPKKLISIAFFSLFSLISNAVARTTTTAGLAKKDDFRGITAKNAD
jgi:hypothetical protein